MENHTTSNITLHGINTGPSDLPLYLSTHKDIPDVFMHELAVAWMVAGMVFNSMLIYYLLATKKYKTPVFMLVLFLAHSDLVVCWSIVCFAGFMFPSYILPKGTWIVCKIVNYLLNVAASTSPYCLILFAAMRYYQLCFPLRARARVTSSFVRNWCFLIISVWTVSWSPFLISYNLIDVMYDGSPSIICQYAGNLWRYASIAFLIINTSIPGISIPVLHIMKHIGVARTRNSVDVQQERKNTDIRALMIIIALFYIGWFPMNIYWMVYKYLPNHEPFQDRLALLFLYASGSNNALNPVVYCLAAKSVRSDIVQLFCKKKADKTKLNPT